MSVERTTFTPVINEFEPEISRWPDASVSVITGIAAASVTATFYHDSQATWEANQNARVEVVQKRVEEIGAKQTFMSNLYQAYNDPNTKLQLQYPLKVVIAPRTDLASERANRDFNTYYVEHRADPDMGDISTQIESPDGFDMNQVNTLILKREGELNNSKVQASTEVSSIKNEASDAGGLLTGTIVGTGCLAVGSYFLSRKVRQFFAKKYHERQVEKSIRALPETVESFVRYETEA